MNAGQFARRSVVTGLMLAGLAGKGAALGPGRAAGPLATRDRAELSRRLGSYLALVETGDAARLGYRTEGGADRLDALLAGRRATLRTLALDEGAGLLGAELLISPAESRPADARLVFFRLTAGSIADTVLVEESARFMPGNGIALRPSDPAPGPLPDSVRSRTMTSRKFQDYVDLFGRFDERFVEYYTPDVVFSGAPAPAPQHGREAILRLYRPLRANLGENITVHHLAIDNRAGLMMAAITNRLTAYGEVQLPSRRMQAGDELILSGSVIYELRGGRISMIRETGG